MESFDQLLRQAESAHGHLCAGQILGVRMAQLGLGRLEIADPRGADRKRLITYVEIDRCATDAIAVVTGCRLGWGRRKPTAMRFARLLRLRRPIRASLLDLFGSLRAGPCERTLLGVPQGRRTTRTTPVSRVFRQAARTVGWGSGVFTPRYSS